MKNSILTLAFFVFCCTSAYPQFSFGAGASLFIEAPSSIGLQGKAFYEVNETWVGSATFTYYIEKYTFFTADLDAHYSEFPIGEGIVLSPLAGLNITRVNVELGRGQEVGGTDLGINIGAMFRVPAGDLLLYGEPKIVLGDAAAFMINAGVLF